MRNNLLGIGIALLIAALIIAGTFFIDSLVDRKCKTKFGKEWSSRMYSHGPSICVNPKGEVRYP